MRVIELFAGVGGFRLGLERAGHEVVYANEWDKYACDTYDKNFSQCQDCRMGRDGQADIRLPERQETLDSPRADIPQAQRYDGRSLNGARSETDNRSCPHAHLIDRRDLTTVPAADLPPHDLICGGFPCQAFSIAGKRLGFEETRGTLFFEILRLSRYHGTPYLFLENVKGLLNHDGGRTFDTIIRALDESGYDCQWQVLNSKNFGVPQNRERVIIVANLRDRPRPEVFPLGGADREDTDSEGQPEWVFGQQDMYRYIANTYERNEHRGQAPVGDKPPQPNSDTGTVQIQQLNDPDHSNNRVYGADGISPALTTMQGGNTQPFIATHYGFKDKPVEFHSISPTLKAQSHGHEPMAVEEGRIRRLTPIECERLQGFPDNWTEGVSDTQRYKQMGNAVTTNVIEAVARRLPL